MFLICHLTVSAEIARERAISLFIWPSAISCNIWNSRSLSSPGISGLPLLNGVPSTGPRLSAQDPCTPLFSVQAEEDSFIPISKGCKVSPASRKRPVRCCCSASCTTGWNVVRAAAVLPLFHKANDQSVRRRAAVNLSPGFPDRRPSQPVKRRLAVPGLWREEAGCG